MKKICYFTLYIITGILLIADIYVLISSLNSFRGSTRADAVVSSVRPYEDISGNSHYDVFVTFTVDQKTYNDIAIDDDTTEFAVDDKLTVYYQQLPPQTVQTKLFYHKIMIIISLIALVFALAGTGFLLWERKKKKNDNQRKSFDAP